MKSHLIFGFILLLAINYGSSDPMSSADDFAAKPYGPYYCQARCLASCLETYLAQNLDECAKFCPPFGNDLPCPEGDAKCWSTCGVPDSAIDQPAPEAPVLLEDALDPQDEPDPFSIELNWGSVENASVYIVEFYPLNREAKPGESNFFRAMTTALGYSVRKEDECVQYYARVFAVNSFGISESARAPFSAPAPVMSSDTHFSVLDISRDPFANNMVKVTIDYTFPLGWPVEDVEIEEIQVTADSCNPALAPYSNRPALNVIIGKTPTTAIQLSFFDDVLQSDCVYHMRVVSISSRCNTTVYYGENSTVGIDFPINCDSFPGACANSTNEDDDDDSETLPVMAPIPVPDTVSIDPDAVVPPLKLPEGIDEPDETSTPVEAPVPEMPTPPPLPLFVIDENGDFPMAPPQEQPMPPGAGFSVVDFSPNGTGIENVQIAPRLIVPPLCEQDMFDVQPSVSTLSPSLIDLSVLWLERQPLPPPPPALYFVVRYGPLVRQLVDDNRQDDEIIPGYEMFMRTGQDQSPDLPMIPDPTRQINISGLQRSSLLKVQICAIYDIHSEPMLDWTSVSSHRIDLAALEPFLELETAQTDPPMDSGEIQDLANALIMQSLVDSQVPSQPVEPTVEESEVAIPVVIAVDMKHGRSDDDDDSYGWLAIVAGIMMVVMTAMIVFVCLRRTCNGGRRMVKVIDNDHHKHLVLVTSTQVPPPPFTTEMVKTPIV